MHFLCSYRPIIRTKQGRQAVEKYGFKKYVDGSCRREPDFENPYPSITALCRSTRFVPRLYVGNKVVYITKKGNYEGLKESHWRITAVLQVKLRFNSHLEASDWYKTENIELPRNCMITGNEPLELDKTDGEVGANLKQKRQRFGDVKTAKLWDAGYQERADKCGVFLVCDALFLNLTNPPILTHEEMTNVFGKIPGTQNPPKISEIEFSELTKIIHSKA